MSTPITMPSPTSVQMKTGVELDRASNSSLTLRVLQSSRASSLSWRLPPARCAVRSIYRKTTSRMMIRTSVPSPMYM
ncbi:MAG: hypothetical protein EA388_06095 [Nitriliruptor sp.]|nr:MAG: hypothetical protein EA388_06095 [Nitriliruptor sp.]